VKWPSEKVKPHVCGGVPTDWRDIGVVVASAFMVPVFLGGVPTDWRDIGVVASAFMVPVFLTFLYTIRSHWRALSCLQAGHCC
jgi:hypothetical protein